MSDFLDESTDIMRRLNEGLLQLDQTVKLGVAPAPGDEELLNSIFRAAHSLKGLSGMMGLHDLNALTHKIENVFDAVRVGRIVASHDVVDVSFQAVDRLDAMLELLKAGEQGEVEFQSVLTRIEKVLESHPSVASPHDVDASTSDSCLRETDPLSGIQDDADIPAKYLAVFVDESEMTLDAVSDTLLQTIDAAGLESLLVGCHRLKGSAASIGLRRIARVAHLIEDRLQDLRRREELPSTDLIDGLLRSIDAMRAYVQGLHNGTPSDDVLGAACRQVASMDAPEMSTSTTTKARTLSPDDVIRRQLQTAIAAAPRMGAGFIGVVRFEPNLALVELKAQLLLEKLRRHGTVFFSAPVEEELETVHELSHLTFGLVTDATSEIVEADLRISGVTSTELTTWKTDDHVAGAEPAEAVVDTPSDQPAAAATVLNSGPMSSGEPKSKPAETLRVDIERLDQLMNLAGQLVITKARFSQIGQKFKRLFSDKQLAHSLSEAVKQTERLSDDVRRREGDSEIDANSLWTKTKQIQEELVKAQRDLGRFREVRGLLSDLAEAIHQLDRVSDGIQSSVMDTRMVPIGPLFSRFKRVVRDLSRTSSKEINLVIRGEHTELDKRMIDELGDPLIHLIRNSADHGIETPEGREVAGKDRCGTITLDAFHRGNRIVIQVADDGRGLDAGRIRAKAVAKGWMSEADADKLTDAQAHHLIWRPGFSTAEKVTEVSGRGMGMDIVWSKIEQLNGTVELTSTPGCGTMFEIRLPLTMAILPSLLMVIGRDVFAVPVESVTEIVRIGPCDVTTVYGSPTTRVRGRVISLVRLNELFDDAAAETSESTSLTVVIVGSEGREIGVIVDDLLGEQDVVIKSLTENFQNVPGIAGASILGDGRVSLILDVAALLQMACRDSQSSTGA